MSNEDLEQKGRTALRRIFWRMIYHEKKKRKRGCQLHEQLQMPLSYEIEIRVYLSELMNSIDSPTGKYIIQKIVLDGFMEREVAYDLKITQQAVNKYKKNYLAMLAKQLKRSTICWHQPSGGTRMRSRPFFRCSKKISIRYRAKPSI